jgi:hypothetical protein
MITLRYPDSMGLIRTKWEKNGGYERWSWSCFPDESR